MFEFYTVLCTVGMVLLYCLHRWRSVTSGLPAGPFNPFGYIFKANTKESVRYMVNLRRQYGGMCSMNVLGYPVVYLNNHEKIKQVYVALGEATSGRIDLTVVKNKASEGRGILVNDGHSWQEHRRFALSTLRDFGFGRGGTVQIIQCELKEMIEQYGSLAGQPFDPHVSLNSATCNVICALVFGERCGTEPEFQVVQNLIQTFLSTGGRMHDSTAVTLHRIMSRLPVSMQPAGLKSLEGVSEYLISKLNAHKAAFKGQVNDLIDAYLKEMQEQNKQTFSDVELRRTIIDLFIAGTETTATTLRWAMLFMLLHPEVQKRVQAEIDQELLGHEPDPAQRKSLVYTDAVLMEVQRFATITPSGGVVHRCTESIKVDDYVIPKDCHLMANIIAAHRDDTIWPDAHNFNVLNFYDEEKKCHRNTEYLIPFSVGRRACLGESLAKQELFIFFVGLLQHFDLLPAPGETLPSPDDGNFGRIHRAPTFHIAMRRRN